MDCVYRIFDWAETNCLQQLMQFIDERANALGANIMIDVLINTMTQAIRHHRFLRKGDYMV